MSIVKSWMLGLLLLLQVIGAQAHPPGLSSLELILNGSDLEVKATFALQDIEAFVPMDSDLDAEVSVNELEVAKPHVAQLLSEQLIVFADAQALNASAPGVVGYDDQNNAHVVFRFHTMPVKSLKVESRFLDLLPEGHQQYVTVKQTAGKTLQEKMLTKEDQQIQIEMMDGGTLAETKSSPFSDFFALGVEHIVTGYDHLLFLFALLAVTHSVWPALKIITFFTIAHSITLAFAGLNLIDLPGTIVEPLIAATIIYVGIENIIRGEQPKGRHWLTFGFGLIHGFGFAGVLREMHISSGDNGILLPLLSFNLGIETGQIVIASLVLPMIWWFNKRLTIAKQCLRVISIMACLMGSYWFLERTLL